MVINYYKQPQANAGRPPTVEIQKLERDPTGRTAMSSPCVFYFFGF